MQKLTKYFVIIFSTIALQSSAQNSFYYKDKFCKGIIFDSSFFILKTIPDMRARITPLSTDIVKAEKILKQNIVQANKTRQNQLSGCPVIDHKLKKYFRQYVGYINNKGQRIIWINMFWNKELIDRASSELIRVNDGCSYYWNVEINLDTDTISNLEINGNG